MSELAIQTNGLKKSFGLDVVLDGLDLEVPRGSVYGFLGENGTGKSTTIQILLDLLEADEGASQVLGMDSSRQAVEIRRNVGYVAEDQKLYDWMTVEEAHWFARQFYPKWDQSRVDQLLERFGLAGDKKLGEFSRGMYSKLRLALALGHNPELLILDEATAGLDAAVRREFLDQVVEMVQDEGRTVFIASHILSDLERVADTVGYLVQGKLQFSLSLNEIKSKYRKVRLTYDCDPPGEVEISGVLRREVLGRDLVLTLGDFSDEIRGQLDKLGAEKWEEISMNLEDIFAECLVERKEES